MNVAQRVGVFARRCKRPDLPVIASPITSRTFGPCSSDERAETSCPVGLENKFSSGTLDAKPTCVVKEQFDHFPEKVILASY